MAMIDSDGCSRYTMTFDELQELYHKFEDFVADCPRVEYEQNKPAIIAVYTLMHRHINYARYEESTR